MAVKETPFGRIHTPEALAEPVLSEGFTVKTSPDGIAIQFTKEPFGDPEEPTSADQDVHVVAHVAILPERFHIFVGQLKAIVEMHGGQVPGQAGRG